MSCAEPTPIHRLRAAACAALLAAASLPAAAQFALAVSPPRFELAGAPGAKLRDVMQLASDDPRATTYTVRTADWRLEPDGSVTFLDELQPGSCRPWVAIERREVTVSANRPWRYRFEVAVPPDAPPQECRFAMMIEGKAVDGALPMAARVGVIVYVAVGQVAPRLEIVGHATGTANGLATPVIQVRNSGTAHGRLDGFLSGTDAAGAALEFTPASGPIMPGETRPVPLVANAAGALGTQVPVRFPVTVRGKLEWGRGQSIPVSLQFAP